MRKKYLFGGGLFVVALTALLVYGIGQFGVPFYTVSELEAKGADMYGRTVRLDGTVVPGTVTKDMETLTATFTLADEEGRTLDVVYKGVKTFEESDPLSVVGIYTESGVLQASDIITKCPSKYEPKEPSAAEG